MRTMKKALMVAATLVLALSLAAPAEASCGTLAQITTVDVSTPGNKTSFIVNTAFQNFPVISGVTYAGTGPYGPYTFSFDPATPAVPPFTTAASISFWRVGTGSTAIGSGDDNGTYDMIANGGFYFSGYYSSSYALGGYLRGGKIVGTWQLGGIDGCVQANSCMCLLISDQDGTNSDWAILGGLSDANLNTLLDIGGTDGVNHFAPILMVPIPTPSVSNIDAIPFGVGFSASVVLSGGNYVQDGCPCETGGGFRIVAAAVPKGDPAPQSRDPANWTHPVTLAGGAAQSSPSAFGSTVDFEIGCGAIGQDVYLAAELAFDSGFRTLHVSADAVGPGLPLSCPAVLVFPRFEPQAATLTFAEAKDGFTFSADYELDENSNGIFPRDEDVSVSFGTYTETIPAGSFVCTGFDCSYKSDGPGITSATVTDTLVSFRAEGIDLTDTKNPVDVEVVIGNDFGLAVVRLRGSLRFGDTDFVFSLSQGSRGGTSSAEP